MSDYFYTSTATSGPHTPVWTAKRDSNGCVTYAMVTMREFAIDAIKAQPFFKPQENSDE